MEHDVSTAVRRVQLQSKHFAIMLASVLGVAALSGCSATAGREGLQVRVDSPPVDGVAPPVPAAQPVSDAASAGACLLGARASIPSSADPKGARRGNYPPAEAPPVGVSPVTRSEAESIARQARGRRGQAVAPPDSPVSSTENSYGAWAQQAGMPLDNFIDPSRCVWVVKVSAPFTPPAPQGQRPVSHASYTVIIDEASRTVIGLTAP